MKDYLTVSALTQYLKRKFTADPYLQKVYLTGEISNFRRRPKHQYFSIKDDQAVINATMFQGVFNKLPFELESGMKVNIVGHLDLYAPSGSYSVIVEKMEPDGIGALAVQFEQLKNKLQKAGLFEKNQRSIPRFPKNIAVITSPSGAVIRDIMTTVQRRYPIAQITLYPAAVQGEQAVPSLLRQLEAVEAKDVYDVLIIGRGGGSMEDLWAFNDEQLALKLAQSPIPVISSVGHETDTTIADYVADQRAATPTAAAEIATPILLTDVQNGLLTLQMQMSHGLGKKLQYLREKFERVRQSRVLNEPSRLYEGVNQRLDLATQNLQNNYGNLIQQKQHQFNLLEQRLTPAMERQLQSKQNRYQQLVNGLNLVSPLAVLARGYSVTTIDETIIKSIDQVKIGKTVKVQVSDGTIVAKVQGVEKQDE
ncbi:exodeoxyribonuclease VII large subunit [Weissella coleopterorum]|uniref:Exodeoxyribonuclease 7 large subunit n=1 Tax=Weissella coleopterorum TaxID=2714949 RepID=A0A6G8AZM8_9LACO|nr:exodeoxyribonuclease VII large subunit [Weissella coleopterorum]QIL50415.1 exodeoxyribonuclease VII large subunit [Weissella coleopterorum]